MIIILTGVAGSGKTTVGRLLEERSGLPFYDGDDYHPEKNVEKMRAGIPLDDDDRLPWLERLANEMAAWEASGGAVLACTAHKESYRRLLARNVDDVRFVYLKGSSELLLERVKGRTGHYMPPSLLDSALEIFEEPAEALWIDITLPPEEITDLILKKYELT